MERVSKLRHMKTYLENLKLDLLKWDVRSNEENENTKVEVRSKVKENFQIEQVYISNPIVAST